MILLVWMGNLVCHYKLQRQGTRADENNWIQQTAVTA